jgi:hypothetical protein
VCGFAETTCFQTRGHLSGPREVTHLSAAATHLSATGVPETPLLGGVGLATWRAIGPILFSIGPIWAIPLTRTTLQAYNPKP